VSEGIDLKEVPKRDPRRAITGLLRSRVIREHQPEAFHSPRPTTFRIRASKLTPSQTERSSSCAMVWSTRGTTDKGIAQAASVRVADNALTRRFVELTGFEPVTPSFAKDGVKGSDPGDSAHMSLLCAAAVPRQEAPELRAPELTAGSVELQSMVFRPPVERLWICRLKQGAHRRRDRAPRLPRRLP
jgi:hypothetical protein